MNNNNMRSQQYNKGAGTYGSNGFIPAHTQAHVQSESRGCMSIVIMFVLSASVLTGLLIHFI
jgi:hypothetical protein